MNHNLECERKSAVIVGGGINGLSIAWRLSKENFDVTVLEQQNFIGGLATSIPSNGYQMDIGPHYLTLPEKSSISEDIVKLVGIENIIKIPNIVKSYKAYYQGHLLDVYPSIYDIMFKSGIIFLIKSSWDFFIAKNFKNHEKEDTIENYLLATYGKSLYKVWFKPYILQNESIGDTQLSKKKIEQTFPPLSIKIISSYLFKKIINKKETIDKKEEYFDCYFKHGMGEIINSLQKEIVKNNGEIITGIKIVSIDHKIDKKIISYKKGNEINNISSDIIVYSIPLKHTLNWFDKIPNTFAKSKLSAYNSIITFLQIDSSILFDGWLIQIYDEELSFFRITQQNYLSDKISPTNKSLLCVETKCTENDEIWKKQETDIYKIIKKDLEKTGILNQKTIDNHKIIKLKNIYRFSNEDDNVDINKQIDNYIRTFKNEFSIMSTTVDSGRLLTSIEDESEPRLGGMYEAFLSSDKLFKHIMNGN